MEGRQELDLFFKLSIIILVGLLGGRVAQKLALPSVSGYIVAGLILGPSFIDLVSRQDLSSLSFITDIALAAIAFSIGNEFLISDMKKVGTRIFLIAVAEVIGAFIVVFIVMFYIFNQPLEFSLVISSMSAATAPAGIVMVIRELRADGPLVKTILPVVALDDAFGIMAFGVALSLAKMASGMEEFTVLRLISAPLIEIFGSLLLGFILGLMLTYLAKRAKNRNELLIISIAFILATVGIANFFNLSPLLTAMMMGGTLVNLKQNAKRVFGTVNDFTPPIDLLFFTLAGMSLDIKVLATVSTLGIGYILARALGKIIGAGVGAVALKESKTIQKYLGLSLLTQGGISIGLSSIVANELPQFSESIITVILFSVLVFEIMGPIFAKIAITKAGEVNGVLKNQKVK